MGFVSDTHMSQLISPADFGMSAGTWALAESSHLVSRDRSAGDGEVTVLIPVKLPSNSSGLKGTRLKSIDVWYSIGTAAVDDFATVELEKMILSPDDTAIAGAEVSITEDAGHDTAAERKAVDSDHCMTVSLGEPAWIDDGDLYWLKLVIDCAATTVLKFFAARANFDLRL
jgi:hypothetical protein